MSPNFAVVAYGKDTSGRAWERFAAKVEFTDSCWLWTASTMRDGYGRFCYRNRRWLAHRWAWTFLRGPIPDGLSVDHLCRVVQCVNPDHLEPVPIAENIRRSPHSHKTHCIRGHEFTPDNILWQRDGGRRCRACKREYERDYMKARRAAA